MTASGFIFACIVNYANYDLEPVKEMYARQHVIPGLSDGGAHVAFISDASFPTFLFSYWGRDRGADRMDIPDLVRRQTREPARFAGLRDRGVLAPGMKADINVIDFANLALGAAADGGRSARRRAAPVAEGARLCGDGEGRADHLSQRRCDRRAAGRPGPQPTDGVIGACWKPGAGQ